MLLKLKIKNIALISESVIEFGEGLNVLTGETGAGKSLIIDSLNFVLGARADKSLIKSGQDYAFVEAVFSLNSISVEIENFLSLIGVEQEPTIIISRYLNINGKTEIKVNGEIVTNSLLKKLTIYLVDIHGQHAHQSLLDVKNHLTILDAFGDVEIDIIKQRVVDKLQDIKLVNNSISEIGGIGQERERNIDLIKYQIDEIEKANLRLNEDEELQTKKTLMANAEKIFNNLSQTTQALQEGEINSLGLLKIALNNLKGITQYDLELNKAYSKLETLYFELQDQSESLADRNKELDYSEEQLNAIMERLEFIKLLKKKYGNTIPEILTYLQESKDKLQKLINAEQELEKLNTQKEKLLSELYFICVELTTARKNIAQVIEGRIVKQLSELGMKNAKFEVVFTNEYTKQDIEKVANSNGADIVEFMFSANLGEPVKPLSKIISGGEMSRFMLAIKGVINEGTNKTFVFDEIDNGIGGVTGLIVAQKLANIAKDNQVICVTHLAQIASFANTHFKISKFEEEGKTKSVITPLTAEQKVAEVSRLLGAEEDSQIGLLHAKEMLNNANKQDN